MNKLKINITKANLHSFDVSANEEGLPDVSVTLALMTDGGKPITTYTARTNNWNDKDKLNLPIEAIPLIGELAKILERAAVKHCRDSQLALPIPKKQTATLKGFPNIPDGTEVNVIDVGDEAINLEDIPF